MGVEAAYIGARTRKIAITNSASNIFVAAAGPPVIPYRLHGRGVCAILIQNNSGNEWYYGFTNTITVPGGLNPGIWIPKNKGSVSLQLSASILDDAGLWIISEGAGPDEGVVAEFI